MDVPQLLTTHFPQHGPYIGVYAIVVEGGIVRVGDPVVVEAQESGVGGVAAGSIEASGPEAVRMAGSFSNRLGGALLVALLLAVVAPALVPMLAVGHDTLP